MYVQALHANQSELEKSTYVDVQQTRQLDIDRLCWRGSCESTDEARRLLHAGQRSARRYQVLAGVDEWRVLSSELLVSEKREGASLRRTTVSGCHNGFRSSLR